MKNKKMFLYTLLSILLGLVFGAIVLICSHFNPGEVYSHMFIGFLGSPKSIAYTLIKATPLILTGLSISFAFRTGLFNIGAEGQFVIGALVTAYVGYFVHLPKIPHILLCILCGVIAAGLWGAIAGLLKSKFEINEVISTIMLNWIALYLNNYIISKATGFKKNGSDATFDIQQTASIKLFEQWKTSAKGRGFLREHEILRKVFQTPVNAGVIIAIIVVILIWVLLNKTTLGYQLRAVGFNKDAAEYGGINVNKNMVISMAIAGMLAGLSGSLHVLGFSHNVAILTAEQGFGSQGIAVSLIANNNPIGCIFAAILFGGLNYGGVKVQQALNTPSEIINIVIGTIILFISMPTIYKMVGDKFKSKRGGKDA